MKGQKRSQNQLAKDLGISKSFLSMILSGQRQCPESLKAQVSEHLKANSKILSHARLPIPTPPQIQNRADSGYLVVDSPQIEDFINSGPQGTSHNTIAFYQSTLKKFNRLSSSK